MNWGSFSLKMKLKDKVKFNGNLFKSLKNKSQSTLNFSVTWLLVIIMFALLFLISAALILKQNAEKNNLLAEQVDLKAILDQKKAEAAKIDQQESMAGEPEVIEKLARDELGMIRKDEIIFIDVN